MVADNPDYDPMTIIEADLEWAVCDDGDMMELNSEFYMYWIKPDNTLLVYKGDKEIAERNCKDLAHAEAIAEAFERGAKRSKLRGCTWHGKPV
jgi:hypothetical protein